MKNKTRFASRAATVLVCALGYCFLAVLTGTAAAVDFSAQQPNTWVKRRAFAAHLSYESAMAWDTLRHKIIRLKAHNLNGGCQHNELYLYDPVADSWTRRGADIEPPGNCRMPQHVYDPEHDRYFRFTGTSGDHGWQWMREVWANESSVWSYDIAGNRWHNMRALPEPPVGPERAASWDSDNGVIVVFGGVRGSPTSVYDPHTNLWHIMSPSNQPAKRTGGCFAYDPVRQLHVLFGSEGIQTGTWAYDLAHNTWISLPVPQSPPTDCIGGNEATLVYDPINRVFIAVLLIRESGTREDGPSYDPVTQPRHLETWILDTAVNRWTQMNPSPSADPGGIRCRILSFAPEYNVAFYDVIDSHPSDGYSGREQEVWTYRYANGGAVLAPQGLRVTVYGGGSADLAWSPPPGGLTPARYNIYRGSGADVPWQATYAKIAEVTGTTYADTGLQQGTHYFYRVRAVGADGVESLGGATGRAQPPVIEDVVVSVVSAQEVQLAWLPPNSGGEMTGYIVERAPAAASVAGPHVFNACEGLGAFTRLTPHPIPYPRYVDRSVNLTQKIPFTVESPVKRYNNTAPTDTANYAYAIYAYRVRAVNALGLESGPSPYVLTVPPQVRFLQARVSGSTVNLKWEAAPGPGIRGYRVRRLNGVLNRKVEPVILTANPITATEYTVTDASAAARFYVVAVDALDQEGYPSNSVWGNQPSDETYYNRYETWGWRGAENGSALPFDFGGPCDSRDWIGYSDSPGVGRTYSLAKARADRETNDAPRK